MTTVRGVIDGAVYDVVLTGRKHEPVQGSGRVRSLVDLAVRNERMVMLGPTGPRVRVDPGRPETVLAVLATDTSVTAVAGPPAALAAGKPGIIW